MNVGEVREAVAEARKFIEKADAFIDEAGREVVWDCGSQARSPRYEDGVAPDRGMHGGTAASGALRRSSMDLSRSLSRMREY